jgi:hypothetical protein
MSNQFFGFSPESFEQFARAVALCVFGPGVTTFGNGPDGGREATFRGKVKYPFPESTEWSGYGVIQAKCKEKAESTEKDQQWALKLLRDELTAFVASPKRTPKPEYYVFVTNVELSSAAGGGRDRADAELSSFCGKLPLKGHAVWDANQLEGFLSRYEELRKRFAAYLTPGDVLAAMLADMEHRRPNATAILRGFLDRELRADESARLDQAGNRTDKQLQLARLFFDLPASRDQSLVPPTDSPDASGNLSSGVLVDLLIHGSRKLDPKTIYEHEIESDVHRERMPSRFVLLGGPGSGKSTLGQFLAQIHRSALLERSEPHFLEPEARQIIAETKFLCEKDRLPWPATPRYPFRVELKRFAKSLSSAGPEHVDSLERYLLVSLKREHELGHRDFVEWLSAYPWLLILDGLDEVPATSNRDAVIKAVNDFLAEARQASADLFVVATSRQQGYAGEFAGSRVESRYLLPLSTARSLRYVERYADARFGTTDPNRATELVETLRQSATRPLTAQLMSSPLQVTFMATVVSARGDPGQDRWQLFSKYYRTIYDRECQKAIPPFDAVLSPKQIIIDRLHHDVGFILQQRGETAGLDSVSLSHADFEKLVDSYLAEEGYKEASKKAFVDLIAGAANERLVFLTSRRPGELSFDVRSLQEFMAAECLMSGGPDIVKERLRAIATSAYWRNVCVFAAAKCFADAPSRHLQSEIRWLCEDLNNAQDPLVGKTRAGSDLALSILENGAVAANPNHARQLARVALSSVAKPGDFTRNRRGREWPIDASHSQALALVYRDAMETVYVEQLRLYLGQSRVEEAIGAWQLVVRLIRAKVAWASDLARQFWPGDPSRQLELARHLWPVLSFSTFLQEKVELLIPWLSQKDVRHFYRSTPPLYSYRVLQRLELKRTRDIADFVVRKTHHIEVKLRLTEGTRSPLTLSINGLSHEEFRPLFGPDALKCLPRQSETWLPFILDAEFRRKPHRASLAGALREFAGFGQGHLVGQLHRRLQWPLAACLAVAKSPAELIALADRVDRGDLGDIDDWRAAQARWVSSGIEYSELRGSSTRCVPFDHSFTVRGFPLNVADYMTSLEPNSSKEDLTNLLVAAEQMPPSADRNSLVSALSRACFDCHAFITLTDPNRFRALLASTADGGSIHGLDTHPAELPALAEWIDFFEWLGTTRVWVVSFRWSSSIDHERAWVRAWQRAFVSDPRRLGLLRLLGDSVARLSGAIPDIPRGLLDLDSFSDPRLRIAAVLLRLTRPDTTESEAAYLAGAVIADLNRSHNPELVSTLFRALANHIDKLPAVEVFLARLHDGMPPDVPLGLARCEVLLRKLLNRRASGMATPSQLEKLKLPSLPPQTA